MSVDVAVVVPEVKNIKRKLDPAARSDGELKGAASKTADGPRRQKSEIYFAERIAEIINKSCEI